MALAEYYPEEFDGIVAADPGISLPRAALAEIWDVQTFEALTAPPPAQGAPPFTRLPAAFSDADLHLLREAVLAACDADDGLKDGIVAAFAACTNHKVLPELRKRTCSKGKSDSCLSAAQIAALNRSLRGPHDARDRPLYSDWPWDAGIGSDAWRFWKLGQPGGLPALNLLLGGPATAVIFTTPPSGIGADPQSAFEYALGFDFSHSADRIYATDSTFAQSAWDEISARSPHLEAFRAHGGKLIIPHGVSDPVFSINDTLAWYHEVDVAQGGTAQEFVRVFPVPGMAHCGGGPATDNFDAFAPLRSWVESGKAPSRIEARAGPQTPWPGRSRPLCPYPAIPRYSGHGDVERAESFICQR
jgi:feruloyl esterase